MVHSVAFIGFGEAGQAFAWPGARAYDRKISFPASRAAMLACIHAAGVHGADNAGSVLHEACAVLSLVTAHEALAAAHACAPLLTPGALWFDMNSVAPETKRMAAAEVEMAGGRYVDVAVMAPVLPGRRSVPLLVAGPHAPVAAALLQELDFSDVTIAGPRVGDASAIKMIRSVMVKGIEALSAECFLAAAKAGVADAVAASLDSTSKLRSWEALADYNIERMLAHGLRRGAEMEEAVKTLEELGINPVMTRGTVARQHELGALGITPPAGLAAKLAAIGSDRQEQAA